MNNNNIDKIKTILRGENVKTSVSFNEKIEGSYSNEPDGTRRTINDTEYISANGKWHKYVPGKIIHYTDDEGNQHKVGKERVSYSMPWFCPECKTSMSERDRKYWYKYEVCLDCAMEIETKKRIKGNDWRKDIYEQRLDTIEKWEKDAKEEIEEVARNLNNDSFIQEDGRIEDWSEQDPEEFKEEYFGYIEQEKEHLLEQAEEILVKNDDEEDD